MASPNNRVARVLRELRGVFVLQRRDALAAAAQRDRYLAEHLAFVEQNR